MEGVTDFVLRDLLTSQGGIDFCTTEFLRVTDRLHPNAVFLRYCPELLTGSRTRSGTPVFVQLLGGQAEPLAINAIRAVQMGALGIDLNFGCPAKTVNRHDGGATLLKSCDRIHTIVKTVRQAVSNHIPVSAKIRLGFDDPSVCLENAKAIEEAGANHLTVHCRTKLDGYKPPAHWQWIPKIKEHVKSIPVIANGDIFSVTDFIRCRQETDCNRFMIGRGVMSDPFLFNKIRSHLAEERKADKWSSESLAVEIQNEWHVSTEVIQTFFDRSADYINGYFATARTKQWLKGLSLRSKDAKALFEEIKVIRNPTEFRVRLRV
ncbi:MAG: tRNA-dihydrouridine synthase family protein [Bdellovibrionaceae bacterium]|nr:tRNA-dihydrouridine synthase family protein [Pseudobdellovibrionaceae bacterium]